MFYDLDQYFTNNGAITNPTTENPLVNLFSIVASYKVSKYSNSNSLSGIINLFNKSYSYDKDLTIRLMLNTRDCRGGAGKRDIFKQLLLHFISIEHDEELVARVIKKIPELGRWKDLHCLLGTKFENLMYNMYINGLTNPSCEALVAKYIPRKGPIFNHLFKHYNLTPKQFRKILVEKSKTVEQLMCAKDWNNINFSTVPSIAASRYKKAFAKNANEKYSEYIEKLKSGDTSVKINAGSMYPHELVRALNSTTDKLVIDSINEQWKAIPCEIQNSNDFLTVCDVSSSMSTPVSGNVSAMDVAITLTLLLSERNTGPFKNKFITFSEKPSLISIKSTLFSDKYKEVKSSDWGGSTNFESSFKLILDYAKMFNLTQTQLPKYIIVLSDMEFNSASSKNTNFQVIKKTFEENGYQLPAIVFWNLNSRLDNYPAVVNDNVVMISGWSQHMMKNILSGSVKLNPLEGIISTLNVERYNY